MISMYHETRLQNLPKEIHYLIFDNLDQTSASRLGKTCRYFYYQTRLKLWFSPSFHSISQLFKCSSVLLSAVSTEEMAVINGNDGYLSDSHSQTIANVCDLIRILDLRKISNADILEWNNGRYSPSNIQFEQILTIFIDYCPNIMKLAITNLFDLTDIPLKSQRQVPRLGQYGISMDTLYKISQLTHLDLSGCSYLSPDPLKLMLELHGYNLKYLNLSRLIWLTGDILELVGRQCLKLEHLHLQGSFSIGNDSFIHLNRLERLRTLNLGGQYRLSCQMLEQLGPFNQLQNVILDDCLDLNDQSLLHIIGRKSNHLKRLSIENCSKITDYGLYQVLMHADKLTFLNIGGTLATDKTLSIISEVCKNTLVDLNIRGCQVSDFGICSLMNFTKLSRLNMSNCNRCKTGSVLELISCQMLKNLQLLNIAKCKNVDDIVIRNHLISSKNEPRQKRLMLVKTTTKYSS